MYLFFVKTNIFVRSAEGSVSIIEPDALDI